MDTQVVYGTVPPPPPTNKATSLQTEIKNQLTTLIANILQSAERITFIAETNNDSFTDKIYFGLMKYSLSILPSCKRAIEKKLATTRGTAKDIRLQESTLPAYAKSSCPLGLVNETPAFPTTATATKQTQSHAKQNKIYNIIFKSPLAKIKLSITLISNYRRWLSMASISVVLTAANATASLILEDSSVIGLEPSSSSLSPAVLTAAVAAAALSNRIAEESLKAEENLIYKPPAITTSGNSSIKSTSYIATSTNITTTTILNTIANFSSINAYSLYYNRTTSTTGNIISTSFNSNTTSHSYPLTSTATLAPLAAASTSIFQSFWMGMSWSKALVIAIFMLIILATVIGNTLVILAVSTSRRLRTVTNCFVLNLAITDWLVGTCVMPPAVVLYVVGNWEFGRILCDIWISLDVLLCTASILSLCAISLDRYLAVTQPLTYSKNRRTKRLALFMIFIVWVTALSITCPPFFGWYEPGRREQGNEVCRYNQNKGYVVFSAMGSFFIPLAVMLYVYLRIGFVLTSRRQRIVRDANSERTADNDIDCDNFLSESEHFSCGPQKLPTFKTRWTLEASTSTTTLNAANSKTNSLKCSKCNKAYVDQSLINRQQSFYELVEISRLAVGQNNTNTANTIKSTATHPSLLQCTSLNCKYGVGMCPVAAAAAAGRLSFTISGGHETGTLLHCNDSRSSFSETCLQQAIAQVTQNGQQLPLQNCVMPQQQQNHHNHQHNHHHHHGHHHHRVPMRVSTAKRDRNTAKTLTMVMGGFIACWLPFFVYYLLIPFIPPAAVFEGLMSFLTWVGWVNCAINPFIYAFYNPDFRTAFWRLTCRRICKQKSATAANHINMFRG